MGGFALTQPGLDYSPTAQSGAAPTLSLDDLLGNSKGKKKFVKDQDAAMAIANQALTQATAQKNAQQDAPMTMAPPQVSLTPGPAEIPPPPGTAGPAQLDPNPAPQMQVTGATMPQPAAGGTISGLPKFLPAPRYGAASTDPATGMPSPQSGSLTKLGKLLTVLRMAGQGAAIGSQYKNFGQGFAGAEQFATQQQAQHQGEQEHQMNLATQRANLATLPLQKAWQLQQMALNADFLRQKTLTSGSVQDKNEAQAGRADQLTDAGPKPIVSGDRMMQYRPKDPKANDNGYVDVGPAPDKKPGAPVVKVMGNRSFQLDPDKNTWNDIGPAPAERLPAGAASGTNRAPLPVTPELQSQMDALPAPQRSVLARYDAKTQSALMAVAHGDQPMSIFPPRLTKGAPGITQQEAGGVVQQLWPQYRANLYQTKQQLQNDYSNMKGNGTGAQIGSFNTFLGHAADASDVVNQYRETGSPLINKPINWLRANAMGDPGFTQLQASLYPVREEYLKFLKGNFAPQKEELAAIDRVMSDSSSPAQLQEALKTLAKQAAVRLDSINEGYKTVTGENWPNLIHSNRLASGSKLGIGQDLAGYGSGGQLQGNMPHAGASPQAQSKTAPSGGGKLAKYGGVPFNQ